MFALGGPWDAQRQAGIPRYRQTLLDCAALAQEIGDTTALVSAALANNRGLMSSIGEADEDRIGVLRAALEAVGKGDSAGARQVAHDPRNPSSPSFRRSRRVLSSADEAAAIARRLATSLLWRRF